MIVMIRRDFMHILQMDLAPADSNSKERTIEPTLTT
jgi:hypothetical protein